MDYNVNIIIKKFTDKGSCNMELNEEINKIIAELEYKEAEKVLTDILKEIEEKKSAK